MASMETSSGDKVNYGRCFVGKVPVSFSKETMSEEVLQSLLQENFFTSGPEQSSLEEAGYDKCIDYPHILSHIYFEGYRHACSVDRRSIKSIHPRNGRIVQKLAAPLKLHAFCEAFRRKNSAWSSQLIDTLGAIDGGAPAATLAKILQEGRHFADLAVQLHYGDEIEGENIGFHNDGPNSLVHLSLINYSRRENSL